MQVPGARTTPNELEPLVKHCVELLCAGDFGALAKSYGYAVALGREPSSAIAADLQVSLGEVGAISLAADVDLQIAVKYFAPGEPLVGVVDCTLLASNGKRVLVELVVTNRESHAYISLEQVSAAA